MKRSISITMSLAWSALIICFGIRILRTRVLSVLALLILAQRPLNGVISRNVNLIVIISGVDSVSLRLCDILTRTNGWEKVIDR